MQRLMAVALLSIVVLPPAGTAGLALYQSDVESAQEILSSIDENLEPNLNASLAGLALAAAAFLLTIKDALQKHYGFCRRRFEKKYGEVGVDAADQGPQSSAFKRLNLNASELALAYLAAKERLREARLAGQALVWGFVAFVAALLANLSIDANWHPEVASINDLVSTASPTATGLICLCFGAHWIWKLGSSGDQNNLDADADS